MIISPPSSRVYAEVKARFATAAAPIVSDMLGREWSRRSWLDSGCSTAPAIVKAYKAQSQTYFDAVVSAGVTPTTDKLIAHDLFIRQITNAGFAARMTYVYPWLGGTAATNRINAGSAGPAAGLGTFYGNVTHSAGGVQSDGTTGYFDTTIAPSSVFTLTSGTLFVYKRAAEANGTTRFYAGALQTLGYLSGSLLGHTATGQNNTGAIATDGSPCCTIAANDAPGLMLVTASGSRSESLYYSNSWQDTVTTDATSLVNESMFLLAIRNGPGGAASFFSTVQFGLAGFGGGMSGTEAAIFNTIVKQYMANLGRTAA